MSKGHNKNLAIALFVPWVLIATAAQAASLHDPFGTQSRVAPGTPGYLSAQTPCGPLDMRTPLTLTQVVNRALCASPQTRSAWANAGAQAAQVGVAEGAYLPTLTGNAAISRNHGGLGLSRFPGGGTPNYTQTSAGLTLSYLLYDFGGRAATKANAEALLAAANATQDNTVQTVFLSAVQDYYQVQATQAALDAARLSEKSSLESLNAAIARYNAGTATPADKLQAQTAYSQAVLNRIKAEGDRKNADGVLANVMGLDADTAIRLALPPPRVPTAQFTQHVSDLIAQARRHRPDLAAAEAQTKAAQAAVTAARAAGRPSISASASYSYDRYSGFGGPSRGSSIGLSLSVPLFSGFTTHYRVQAAQAQETASAAQQDNVRLQVALDVWQAYQALLSNTQAVQSSEDLLASASASQDVALGRYKAGVGNILDLISAQASYASAQQQHVQAVYNWNIARVSLARAMGQLDYGTLHQLQSAPAAPAPTP